MKNIMNLIEKCKWIAIVGFFVILMCVSALRGNALQDYYINAISFFMITLALSKKEENYYTHALIINIALEYAFSFFWGSYSFINVIHSSIGIWLFFLYKTFESIKNFYTLEIKTKPLKRRNDFDGKIELYRSKKNKCKIVPMFTKTNNPLIKMVLEDYVLFDRFKNCINRQEIILLLDKASTNTPHHTIGELEDFINFIPKNKPSA